MNPTLLPFLLALVTLLAASAFFSGSEVALFSLDRHTLDELENERGGSGRAIRRLLEDPRRLMATILVGNELVNITVSVVGGEVISEVYKQVLPGEVSAPAWLNVLLITPALLLFGEMTPKAIAVRLGRSWARWAAVPLSLFMTLVSPLRIVLQGIASVLLSPFGALPDPLPQLLQENQFRALVDQGRRQGTLDHGEAELIHRVFDLSDTPVSRIMTPRNDVQSISLATPLSEVLESVRESRFSRMPVHMGDPDSVRGVLLTKDLLRFRWEDAEFTPRTLERALKPVAFVPPGKTAGSLLRDFQKSRQHMAVVIDEFGAMLGIVTMQDLLEELFLATPEELDDKRDERRVERISEGVYRVHARVEVSHWNRAMSPPLPEGDSYTTLAGYVLHLFGHLPKKGEECHDAHWAFHVSGIEGTRLTQLTARRRSGRTDTP